MFALFYPVPFYIPFLVWDALQPEPEEEPPTVC
jgi:hypothetical protein